MTDYRWTPAESVTSNRIRLEVTWSGGPGRLAVTVPRVPVTVSLLTLSRTEAVTSSWKLAFFSPCLVPPAEKRGAVDIPRYWLTREQLVNEMEFARGVGGPLAGLLDLTTVAPIPTYVPNDTDPALTELHVFELVPRFTSRVGPPKQDRQRQSGFRPGAPL